MTFKFFCKVYYRRRGKEGKGEGGEERGWAQGVDPTRYTSVVRAYLALDDLGVRGPPPSDGGIIDNGFENFKGVPDPYDAIDALKRAGAVP